MAQIFNEKKYIMDNINLDIIENIECKCINKESLSENELNYFLSYVCFEVRKMICDNKNQSIEEFNFLNQCDKAQAMIVNYLKNLNVDVMAIDTQKALGDNIVGHRTVTAKFLVAGKTEPYLIDPTYNQFFDKDMCDEKEFLIIKNLIIKTPSPGYFVLKDSENVEIIKDLLIFGYMPFSQQYAKTYVNSFWSTMSGIPRNYSMGHLKESICLKTFLKNNCDLTYNKEQLKAENLLLNPIYKNNLKLKNK